MNSSVSFATEQRVLRRAYSGSNLVIVAEKPDFEVAQKLRRLMNCGIKETAFSRANLSWRPFQILPGASAAVVGGAVVDRLSPRRRRGPSMARAESVDSV